MKSEDEAIDFIKYPPTVKEDRAGYLEMKTPEQFRKIKKVQVQAQFETLETAVINEEAFNTKNQKLDRYSNVFTYEHSRVKIQGKPDFYVNANEIKSLVDGKVFAIFGQSPVKPFDNFWEAVYEKKVQTVIMLCSFYDPKRGKQSEQYWPELSEKLKVCGGKLQVQNLEVKLISTDLTQRIFALHGQKGKRQINHYHWTGWSDLRKPAQHKMDEFQFLLELCLKLIESGEMIMIHCSAGIGRTGTLGGIIEANRLLKHKNAFSIYAIVQNLRKYRYHSIQTFEQYLFLYSYMKSKKL